MSEWILFLAPGALSYVVSVGLSGKKSASSVQALLEWLFLCGLDTCLVWFLSGADKELGLQELALGATGYDLCIGLLGGLAVGIAAAYFRLLSIKAWAEHESPGLWEKLSPSARRILKRICTLILMVLLLLAVCWPRIRQEQEKALEDTYREHVMTTWKELQQKLETLSSDGGKLKNPGDIETSVVTVRQVSKDQGWSRNGSGHPTEEAVYMVDGEGTLVYFSFRDETHGTSWSGPSQDNDFISANRGWNGGMGFGWNGYKVQ